MTESTLYVFSQYLELIENSAAAILDEIAELRVLIEAQKQKQKQK